MPDIHCDFDAACIDFQFESASDLISFLIGFISVMADFPDVGEVKDD